MDHAYVLIVDDDPDATEVMALMVESLGVPVQVATDGVKALERINERRPDLVVLDLMMPRKDGLTVLGHLKLDPEKRNIPVLVLTALKLDEDVKAELPDSVIDVVEKGATNLDYIRRVIETHSNPQLSSIMRHILDCIMFG